MLATLLGRVVAGEGAVALLAVTLATAPLVALLARGAAPGPASRVGDIALLVVSMLLLAANLIVLGDLAQALGFARQYGIATGALLAVTALTAPRPEAWWRLAIPLGALVVAAPVALVVSSLGAPWTVWATVASRPALTFDAGSSWVTVGHTFAQRARLVFDEPHRVVAAAPAIWRVIERDVPGAMVREWRLGIGDTLTLRPGDELALEAGARVRFEAGRRVPGSPPSGSAWADGRTTPQPLAPLAAVGLVLTLVGGALGLVHRRADTHARPDPPRSRVRRWLHVAGVVCVPVLSVGFVASSVAWGLYGVAVAPELTIAPSPLAAVIDVTAGLAPAWGPLLETAVTCGIVLLFVGFVTTWPSLPAPLVRAALGEARAPRASGTVAAVSAGIVIAAAVVALQNADPWPWFTWALGLAAAASAAPRLAAAGARGEAVGGVLGAVVFAVAVLAPDQLPAGLRPLTDHPALLAAPLAWTVARLARSHSRPVRVRASVAHRGAIRT